MFVLRVPLNTEANGVVFNAWMLENHSYEGIAHEVEGLVVSFKIEPTELIQEGISSYYSSLTESDSLELYKKEKSELINDRTVELVSNGYSFGGKVFSLSKNAQTNILALFATKDNPALTYPVEFNTIDDLEKYSAANAPTIEGMYLTALGTKKAHLDSGSILKDAVRAATTKAEVDLVVDNR